MAFRFMSDYYLAVFLMEQHGHINERTFLRMRDDLDEVLDRRTTGDE